MTVLRLLGHTNLNEVNVTHTAMSAGGMVAGGVAFTIPGIWMIQGDAVVNPWELFIVVLAGTILGVIFCALYRRQFVEEMQLPYPMGKASADTLLAGDEGGTKAKYLFSSLGIVAVFTAYAESTMVSGLPNPPAFIAGLVVGIILYWLNLPATTIGIGVYLPMFISTTTALGGLIRFLTNKYNPNVTEKGELMASGALGGEGVAGVIIAIAHVISGT